MPSQLQRLSRQIELMSVSIKGRICDTAVEATKKTVYVRDVCIRNCLSHGYSCNPDQAVDALRYVVVAQCYSFTSTSVASRWFQSTKVFFCILWSMVY